MSLSTCSGVDVNAGFASGFEPPSPCVSSRGRLLSSPLTLRLVSNLHPTALDAERGRKPNMITFGSHNGENR